jgi:hypothetical protein
LTTGARGGFKPPQKIYYNSSKKMFIGRAKLIRIIGDPDNQRLDKCSSIAIE